MMRFRSMTAFLATSMLVLTSVLAPSLNAQESTPASAESSAVLHVYGCLDVGPEGGAEDGAMCQTRPQAGVELRFAPTDGTALSGTTDGDGGLTTTVAPGTYVFEKIGSFERFQLVCMAEDGSPQPAESLAIESGKTTVCDIYVVLPKSTAPAATPVVPEASGQQPKPDTKIVVNPPKTTVPATGSSASSTRASATKTTASKTPAPSGVVIKDNFGAYIIEGTCADLTSLPKPVETLQPATVDKTEPIGQKDATTAAASSTVITPTINDLTASPHAVVVATTTDAPQVLGCAPIGGKPDTSGGLSIVMNATPGHKTNGVVYIAEREDGTHVTIFVHPDE